MSGGAARRGGRDALGEAASHARSAGSELIAALRVISEALPQPSARQTLLPLLRGLEHWLERLGQADLGALRGTLHAALDVEIRRWEARSSSDADARTVLRAFLAVREALWDLGIRPPDADAQPAAEPPGRGGAPAEPAAPEAQARGESADPEPPAAGAPRRRRRAQHVPVRG